ncbi:MAG: acyl carrier protein [Gemmatimonadota bacterium]|nr:acyl carrier protein [Gemmatimonadota bacterium]
MTGDASQVLERIFRSVLKAGPDTEITTLSVDSHGGWDSIAHLNLILAVEQEFRFMMTPEEATAARSFGDMLALVESRR